MSAISINLKKKKVKSDMLADRTPVHITALPRIMSTGLADPQLSVLPHRALHVGLHQTEKLV